MAEPRPLTARETQAFERLPLYNVRRYDPVENPYGFDEDGYLFNQMPQADDAGVVGRLARDMAIIGHENAVAAAKSLTDTKAEAGKVATDIKTAVAADLQAAQDARAGSEAAAGRTADELRAAFTAEVTASQAARKGAEDARDATGLIRDATAGIRDATGVIRDAAQGEADRSTREADRAFASAQSVDGPAIAASIADLSARADAAPRLSYVYSIYFGN